MIPSNKEVHCCDCGLRAEIDPSHFCPPGWEYLQITGRVRCGNCRRDLDESNRRFDQPHHGHSDFQDTMFAPLAPQVEPLGEIEPVPAPPPFSAGGGGDFAGGGAEASFEVAAAPAPADPPASSSYSSDSSSSSSSDSGSSSSGSD